LGELKVKAYLLILRVIGKIAEYITLLGEGVDYSFLRRKKFALVLGGGALFSLFCGAKKLHGG
jgi:hypothetical protein